MRNRSGQLGPLLGVQKCRAFDVLRILVNRGLHGGIRTSIALGGPRVQSDRADDGDTRRQRLGDPLQHGAPGSFGPLYARSWTRRRTGDRSREAFAEAFVHRFIGADSARRVVHAQTRHGQRGSGEQGCQEHGSQGKRDTTRPSLRHSNGSPITATLINHGHLRKRFQTQPAIHGISHALP